MRTSYAVGSGIKLAVFLARKGKDLMTEIKKAVDNIFHQEILNTMQM
jgi:hypothetical protein